jgi:hypothetical protein
LHKQCLLARLFSLLLCIFTTFSDDVLIEAECEEPADQWVLSSEEILGNFTLFKRFFSAIKCICRVDLLIIQNFDVRAATLDNLVILVGIGDRIVLEINVSKLLESGKVHELLLACDIVSFNVENLQILQHRNVEEFVKLVK